MSWREREREGGRNGGRDDKDDIDMRGGGREGEVRLSWDTTGSENGWNMFVPVGVLTRLDGSIRNVSLFSLSAKGDLVSIFSRTWRGMVMRRPDLAVLSCEEEEEVIGLLSPLSARFIRGDEPFNVFLSGGCNK